MYCMRLLPIVFVLLLVGCATKTVTVERVKTETIEKHDTIEMRDTIHHQTNTIIREVDSSFMAEYGIKLDGLQKAWLIEKDNLLKEISRGREVSIVRDTVRDSVPVPYPVEKRVEVEKPLTWWQKTRMAMGNVMIVVLIVLGGVGIRKILNIIKI